MEENKIRIQDDLYHHVNGDWLKTAVIPNDKPTTGGFSDLVENVEQIMIKDFNSMARNEKEIEDENVRKAIDLYNKILDTKKRNKDGIKPALKYLKIYDKLKNINALNKNFKDLVLYNYPLPINIMIETDMMDARHNVLMISGPSTILPDTVYYKEEMAQQRDALLAIWKQMATNVLAFTKKSKEEQDLMIEDTLKFDALIASYVKSSEEWSDYTSMYNPFTMKKVNSLLRPIKFNKICESIFETAPEQVIVADPRFIKNFKVIFNEDNFNLFKNWSYVSFLLRNCSYLSEELRDLSGSYIRALSGVMESSKVEKFAYNLASNIFSEPVGLYYGKTYFGESAKKDVIDIANKIIETYKKRIKNNLVLTTETKEKAISKLDKMVIKMGYPDKSDPVYDRFTVNESDSLLETIMKIEYIISEDSFEKLYKEVDRKKWVMSGHTVNACYDPFRNDITFPAAILQPPFYSINQTRSENLGGIGIVIGHEISHAFDNNGAKIDENGNLHDWWTKEDLKRFKSYTNKMIKQFDKIEVEGTPVNGKLVVSENIADNGGMAVTLDIMKNVSGACYEDYFKTLAKVYCMKAKPEYVKLLLSIDVHSPNILRVNMPPRNFDEWYETFKVKKTDKMYLAPSKRIIIW